MKKIFFIAEIGINHNGDIEIAKKLIDLAKDTGFNAVKFQKRDIDIVYSEDQLNRFHDLDYNPLINPLFVNQVFHLVFDQDFL